jgi:hypothetical protein
MPAQPPDFRARRLIREAQTQADTQATDSLERDFFHLVKTGQAASEEVQLATELYSDNEYRHVLNALLLASANDEHVSASLALPEAVLGVYRHLFFDCKTFAHNLAKTRYVKELVCEEQLKFLYQLAIERGPSELLERYRIGPRSKTDPEFVLSESLSDMWGKFLTHRGYSITSDNAREALKWGEAAIRAAKIVMETNREERRGANAVDDLRIALEIKNETKSMTDLGIQPDDLVVE